MKRSMTFFVALSMTLLLIGASAGAGTPTMIGVKGGLNLANMSFEEGLEIEDDVFIDESSSRTGMVAGAFAAFNVAENLFIQPEFLYSAKGAKFDTTLTVQGVTADVELMLKLDYIEFPVLLKYAIPVQGNIQPVLAVGPSVAIKSTSKMKATASALGQSASEEVDIEEITSTDFGLAFGGGVNIAVGTAKIMLDGRYTLGLTSVDDSDEGLDIKNRVLSVTAALAFPVGGKK